MGYPNPPPPGSGYAPPPTGPATTGASSGFDFATWMSGLSLGDKIRDIASLLALIFVFFPWYGSSVSCSGSFCGASSLSSGSVSGFHDWGILFFLAALALVIYEGLDAFAPNVLSFLDDTPLADWMVELILVGVMLLSGLLFYTSVPSGSSGGVLGYSYSYGLSFGWFLAIIATVAAGVGAFLSRGDPQRVRAAAPPSGGYGTYTGQQPGYGAPQQPGYPQQPQQPQAPYGDPSQPGQQSGQPGGYPPQQ